MSVYVTIRVTVDPEEFEKRAAEYSEVIDRIMAIARAKGVIGHRWMRGDGEILSVDEWPDEQSFKDFFHTAGHEIGPFMNICGVTAAPEVKVWNKVDIHDAHGWGA